MLLLFIATVVAIFILLTGSEWYWRKKQPDNEVSRKFIHLTVGCFVAFWPFFLSWNQIRLLSVAFIIVVLVSKRLHLFQSIHSVQRPTWGEIYFALVVGLLTFVTESKAVYATALLQMSLADGMAAIVGVEYGVKRGKKYSIFGNTKTVIGTATFFVISFALLSGFHIVHPGFGWGPVILLALAATAVENVAKAGLDNLFVPLLVAFVLASFAVA